MSFMKMLYLLQFGIWIPVNIFVVLLHLNLKNNMVRNKNYNVLYINHQYIVQVIQV